MSQAGSSFVRSPGDRDAKAIPLARRWAALFFLAAAGGGVAFLLCVLSWRAVLHGAAGIFSSFYGDWTFPGWTLRCWIQGGGVIVGVVGAGWLMTGTAACRRMLPGFAERLAFAPLAGGVALSLLTLGVALATTATVPMTLLWAACLGVGGAGLVKMAREWRRESPGRWPRQGVLGSPLALLAALFVLAVFSIAAFYASAPAVESDELRYHLAALFEWKLIGRMRYLPNQAFSNFPMLGEMLFLLAMPGGSPLQAGAAKLIHLFFLGVSIAMIALLTRDLTRPASRRAGAWAAAALFATIPSAAVLAGWGFIDLFTVAYFLGFVRLAGRALSRPRRASGVLIGLIAGGGLSVKYTMFPVLGALGAGWVALMTLAPATRRRVARLAATAALAALAACGPWLVRNGLWTGNPVYPLANRVFAGGEWSAQSAAFLAAKTAEKGYAASMARTFGQRPAWTRGRAGRVAEFLATPWTATVAFDCFESHPLGAGPLLMTLLAVGGGLLAPARRGLGRRGLAWRAARMRLGAWVAWAAIASWAIWFLTYQSNRMLFPTIALALAMGGASLERWRAIGAWAGRVAEELMALAMASGFLVYLFLLGAGPPGGPRKADAIAVAFGFQDAGVYLKRNLNYYPAAAWLNENAKPQEGALLVGEHRAMYFGLPLVASDWFDAPQPLPLIRATGDNGQLLDRLLAAGIVYVFYNEDELNRYREAYFRPRFRPEEYARFNELMKSPRLRLEREFKRPGAVGSVFVYRIAPQPQPQARQAPRSSP